MIASIDQFRQLIGAIICECPRPHFPETARTWTNMDMVYMYVSRCLYDMILPCNRSL